MAEKSVKIKERNVFVDLLKAVGIISIVIGHSCEVIPGTQIVIAPFVYTYHLMIFLFVAGFCFKKEDSFNPYAYVGRRLKSVMPYFIIYNVIFVCLHNSLLDWNILADSQGRYGLDQILSGIMGSLTFQTSENMLGTFWFLPMYFFALVFFCFAFYYSEKAEKPVRMHLIFFLISGVVGLYANTKGLSWNYHLQTSVLAIPVVYIGYLAKLYWEKIQKYISWWGGILCALGIAGILSLNIGIVELSVNSIINPWLFYPVTFMGIYFCMSIGKLLEQSRRVRKVFGYIGRNSFHIMALHFVSFKVVDVIYGKINGIDPSGYEAFPHAFDLWWVYWIAGIVIPLGLAAMVKKVFDQLQKKGSKKG